MHIRVWAAKSILYAMLPIWSVYVYVYLCHMLCIDGSICRWYRYIYIYIYIYIGGFYDNDPITKIDVSIYYLWCMYMYIISVIRYSLFPGCLCGVVLDCVLLISVAYGESCPTWLHPSGDGECLCGALW